MDLDPVLLPVADQPPDRLGMVVQVDHGFLDTVTRQVFEDMGDHRTIDQ